MTVRDYAKVLPAFWTGTTGRAIRALGPESQVIALYLMTSPHASAIGLYHLPLAYLCADTGIHLEGARKALRSLSEVSFCAYDEASETVWIPEMARHQVGEAIKASDNRRQWLIKEAERMRKRPFFNDFLTKYGTAFALGIAPDSKPLGSPLGAPSKALRSQEQEQEMEQEGERESTREARPAAALHPPIPDSLPPIPSQAPPSSSAPVERMLRSLSPGSDLESQVVALVSDTRQAAGGAPYRVTSHHDRDAVSRLAEWAASPDTGLRRLRVALEAFWASKGTGARLSWMTDEDPGRWLGKPKGRRSHVAPAGTREEHEAAVAAAGGVGSAIIEI